MNSTGTPAVDEVSTAHLLRRTAVLERHVRETVMRRRALDANPDDAFRGLYVGEDDVDRLLAGAPDPRPGPVLAQQACGDDGSRLSRLTTSAGLLDLDVDLLLVAALPDLDARFERLYGYLNDDVSRRRATVGLALELLGVRATSAHARGRLEPGAPLLDRGLLLVEDLDRPVLTRALRVPDRVTSHLLGGNTVDPDLAPHLVPVHPGGGDLATRAGLVLGAGGLVHVREPLSGSGNPLAAGIAAAAGFDVLAVDLAGLPARAGDGDVGEFLGVVVREAVLRSAAVVATGIDGFAAAHPGGLRRLTGLGVPVVLVGSATWDPAWSEAVPVTLDAVLPGLTERQLVWEEALGSDRATAGGGVVEHFVLGQDQVRRAVVAARAAATVHGRELTADDLRAGARAQNAAGLEHLARRVSPAVGWADLVLPATVLTQLHDLTARARNRDRVLSEWRMRPGGGRGRGITALFTGDSGTGKTMSAEVIAGSLGLDLYAVDLSTVVDKYVGQTEKNLERIFSEAAGVNAVLLFDEADAVFGKRSEVRDAHDRYANIESAYLLQRMESFDGLAILATNLRANVDDAFTRRLDSIVDFPAPSEELRLDLWRRCLAPPLPTADDLDLAHCARAFELSGGNIRSASISAAYLAADAGRPVGMDLLIGAVRQEYRKLGRLVHEREFGSYLELLP